MKTASARVRTASAATRPIRMGNSVASHQKPTVYDEHLTRKVAGRVGRQEDGDVRDVLLGSHPPERDVLGDPGTK
jgi:hypothetical protein